MKENSTEFIIIIDESESMVNHKADVIKRFNSFLSDQKLLCHDDIVSVILCNSQMKTLFDRCPIQNVNELTESMYTPAGDSSLIDTLGNLILRIKTMHKYSYAKSVPEYTRFIIMSQGENDISKDFSLEDIRQMIKIQKEDGWEFQFSGKDIF